MSQLCGFGLVCYFFFHSPIAFSWYLDYLDKWHLKLESMCCKAAKVVPGLGEQKRVVEFVKKKKVKQKTLNIK